jgi:hypothetical protein
MTSTATHVFWALSTVGFLGCAAHEPSEPASPPVDAAEPDAPARVPTGEPPTDVTLHVDAQAGPNGDGSEEAPYRTLGAALTQALITLRAGTPTRITIHPGTYREAVDELSFDEPGLKDTLLVIEASDPATTVWSGSDLFSKEVWRDEGDGLYSANWAHDFGNFAYPWEAKEVLAHRSEMVFVNGEPLRQVLLEQYDYEPGGTVWVSNVGTWTYRGFVSPQTLSKGEFGVAERDENGNRIYLRLPAGTTLHGANVEIAVRKRLLSLLGKNNVVLRNLTFQHVANHTRDLGAEIPVRFAADATDIAIEGCRFVWNNTLGLQIGASGGSPARFTIRDSEFSYNGTSGISVDSLSDSVLSGNETSFNNWRGDRAGDWAIGGIKAHTTRDVRLEDHVAVGNVCPGVWFDVHNESVEIVDLVSALNTVNLFIELSRGPFTIERALLLDGVRQTFRSSVVGTFTMSHSILYSNRSDMLAESVFYLRDDLHASAEAFGPELSEIRDSVFLGGPALGGPLLYDHNGITRSHEYYPFFVYQGRNNLFYSTSSAAPFRYNELEWTERNVDFTAWTSRADEERSRWSDPAFADAAGHDFGLRAGSPLSTSAAELPLKRVPRDKLEEARRFFAWTRWDVAVPGGE